jgi:hypothetical protein
MQPVTFQPGQTCQVVKIPVMGSTTPSATPDDLVQDRDVGPGSAVLGIGDFGTVTVVTKRHRKPLGCGVVPGGHPAGRSAP